MGLLTWISTIGHIYCIEMARQSEFHFCVWVFAWIHGMWTIPDVMFKKISEIGYGSDVLLHQLGPIEESSGLGLQLIPTAKILRPDCPLNPLSPQSPNSAHSPLLIVSGWKSQFSLSKPTSGESLVEAIVGREHVSLRWETSMNHGNVSLSGFTWAIEWAQFSVPFPVQSVAK